MPELDDLRRKSIFSEDEIRRGQLEDLPGGFTVEMKISSDQDMWPGVNPYGALFLFGFGDMGSNMV